MNSIRSFPVLTIAIPTFNRAPFLRICLSQLLSEMRSVTENMVEVLVCDNCSPDDTSKVVDDVRLSGLMVNYVRNQVNIGSDANIAQCFNRGRGQYVLILGDDDVLVDGALKRIVERLLDKNYGMVFLRSYGFDGDFKSELPNSFGSDVSVYPDSGDFLARVAHLVTLISGCVINKSLLPGVDANAFCGGNLVQVHLCLLAATRAKHNLFVHRYEIGVKRNNSGGYDHSRVFVTNFLQILDSFVGHGLVARDVRKIENRLLLSYFPYYLYKLRLQHGDVAEAQKNFSQRFDGNFIYQIWTRPVLYSPRTVALFWAACTTLIGRVIYGDLTRGAYFIFNKVKIYVNKNCAKSNSIIGMPPC